MELLDICICYCIQFSANYDSLPLTKQIVTIANFNSRGTVDYY